MRELPGPIHLAKASESGSGKIVTACDGGLVGNRNRITLLNATWWFGEVSCAACIEIVKAEQVIEAVKATTR